MTVIKTTFKRRSFLKVSAATGGGILLGFSFLAGCKSDEVESKIRALQMPENWYGTNGFIKIGENGVVTIMSPNPEIGQNVKTSMPMIVAEELDVDWKDVIVEQAGLDTVNFKRQLAGGSQSIRLGWKSLRTAGATARKMLMEAASLEWELPIEELSTKDGFIYHNNTKQKLSYGAVASKAAQLEVPSEVKLKDPKDFKIIGQSILNVDGRDLVQGKPLFGIDYEEEGMLIAMIQQAPSFGQKLKSYNKAEIKSLPGIVEVMELNLDFISDDKWYSKAFNKKSMVAIIGRSTWEVMKAKRALKIEWETMSTGESSAQHEEKLLSLLETNNKAIREDGNVKQALANASKVIERIYSAPFLPHNTMSPMNFFADVTNEGARLVGPVQTPEISAGIIADALELPLEKVSIMMTRMGGGFGRRLYGNWLFESALISKAMSSPVKLIYSREDDMMNGTYRPAYKVKYTAGLDEQNNLIAFSVKGAGANGGPVWANRFPAGTIENYEAFDASMSTNISTGAWRAPKSNFIAGAEQAFLDEVAELAEKDPIAFRLDLFNQSKSNPIGEENDYDADRYAGVLELVKEKSGWGNNQDGIYQGASAYYCHNSYVAQVVDVYMSEGKPKIKKVWCAVDCGIVVNPTGAKNQIEGGIIDGIGTAMYGGLTFNNGTPEQNNFGSYQMIRHLDSPVEIETFFVQNGMDPSGLGEPGMPPIIGALANALYKATGERLYEQPFTKKALIG